eukprot:PITA_29523
MNQKLMERVRVMLSSAGLGHEFWVEVVDTTCYLVNRSPSLALEDNTPQEVWTCKKPSLSHLRDGLKGYKLWNLVTWKVGYSRDVVFRRVKDVIKHEVQPKEPEKKEFELKEKELDSTVEEESEDEEPHTPGEVVDSEDGKLWKEATVDEMASFHKNEAWDLVEMLIGRKPIGKKWVFKKKTNAEGKVEKYKARLVAKGYSQVLGIDFGDISSPIAKVTSIRLLLFVATPFDFEVEQMDLKTSFLHRDMEEQIYMKHLEGFVVKGKKELVCKLKNFLYGLKQSPRMWYEKFDTFIRGLGFNGRKAIQCVYFKLIGDNVIYLVLYLDDMFLVGNDNEIIHDLKT